MSLWPRNRPLNQPPHRGRIGAQTEHVRVDPVQADAQRGVAEAQYERKAKTIKHGARATVR